MPDLASDGFMVPFNDLSRKLQASEQRITTAWREVLQSGRFIGGGPVSAFERAFADYCDVPHCVGLANGTDALELGLRALGVERGDRVLTVANAGGYSATACHAIGAVPVYVDVTEHDAQIDLAALTPEALRGVKVVVVTHLYGQMNDVSAIRRKVEQVSGEIAILEDCAQSHGARIDGKLCGGLGDAAAFSFYPTKNLGAVGDAGAVVCRDAAIAQRVRQLAQYGWTQKYHSGLFGGRNSRLDPLQAAVLQMQLETLDACNARRRDICAAYRSALPAGWALLGSSGEDFVGHLAVVVAPSETARDQAIQALKTRDIGTDVHYPIPDFDQSAWRERGELHGTLSMSRALCRRVLSLPCFPELESGEIQQVVDAIGSFNQL